MLKGKKFGMVLGLVILGLALVSNSSAYGGLYGGLYGPIPDEVDEVIERPYYYPPYYSTCLDVHSKSVWPPIYTMNYLPRPYPYPNITTADSDNTSNSPSVNQMVAGLNYPLI